MSRAEPFPEKCKSRYQNGTCFYIDKKVRRQNSSGRYDRPSSNAVENVRDALHCFLSLFNGIIAENVTEENALSLPGYARKYPGFLFSSVMGKIPNKNCHCEAGQNPDHNGSFSKQFHNALPANAIHEFNVFSHGLCHILHDISHFRYLHIRLIRF